MNSEDKSTAHARVSILMTIYNAERYLHYAVDSLIRQTFPAWELIAIENGSFDGSAEILSRYSDSRIRRFDFPENIGRTPALRYAFDKAVCEYVAVLDADDVSHPNRLKRQIEFLDTYPEVGLVGSWAQYIDESGNIFAEFRPPTCHEALYECLAWINPIVHSSAMFRKKLAEEVGGYPHEMLYAQDFGLLLALAQKSHVAVIDEFLCQLRLLESNMSQSKEHRVTVAREGLWLFVESARLLHLSDRARRLNQRTQAIYELKLGIALVTTGAITQGLGFIIRGIKTDPSALWKNGLIQRVTGARTLVGDKFVVYRRR